MRAGCPPDRIIAVEREPRLAVVLPEPISRMTVIEGDATRIGEYFARPRRAAGRRRLQPSDQMVSVGGTAGHRQAVPRAFGTGRTFSSDDQRVLLAAADGTLGIAGREICRVWLNLLPAQIWAHEKSHRLPREDRREPDFAGSRHIARSGFRIFISAPAGAKPIFWSTFLRYNDADTIYLVGDIIDGWRLSDHGIGRKPTTTSSRRCCARSAKVRGSSMSQAITTNGCAITRCCSSAA